MNQDRPAVAWLRDARHYATEAYQIAKDLDLHVFATEFRDQFAIRYCLAVVGEALNRIPEEIQTRAPEIPRAPVIALRLRLVHGYWLIDPEIIFSIARNDTKAVASSLDRLIEKLD
jgi:uncharacterized protein with HEPN domain